MTRRSLWLAVFLSWAAQAAPSNSPSFASEAEAIAAGAQRLTTEEARALYLGHLVAGSHADGSTFRTPISADGHIAANGRRGAGQVTFEDGGRVCMQFADLWHGLPRCWTEYRLDGRYFDFEADGSPGAELRFEALE